MQKMDLKKEIPVDVASGICMGIQRSSDKKIDCLGFKFLDNIKSTVLTNVQYPTLRTVYPKVSIRELKSMTFHNNTQKPQEYRIETSKSLTQKSSWSVTINRELTYSLNVNAGIPKLVGVDTGFELKLGVGGSYTK